MNDSMFPDDVKKQHQALYQARQDFAFQDSSNPISFETFKKYIKLSYQAQHSLDQALFYLPRLADGENARYSKAVFACAYWLIEADVPETHQAFRGALYSELASAIPDSMQRGLAKTVASEALSLFFGKRTMYKEQVTEAWEYEWKILGKLLFDNIQRLQK